MSQTLNFTERSFKILNYFTPNNSCCRFSFFGVATDLFVNYSVDSTNKLLLLALDIFFQRNYNLLLNFYGTYCMNGNYNNIFYRGHIIRF